MRTRPFFLPLFTALLGALALLFPVQLALFYDQLMRHSGISISAHAFFTYGLVTFTLANAFWLYNASPLIKWTLPTLSLALSLYYFYLFRIGVIISPQVVATVFTVALGINFFFLDEKSIFILNHPHLRWWRVPKRKKIKVHAFVSPFRGEGFACETFDLSSGGAFIPFSCPKTRKSLRVHKGKDLKNGDPVYLRLTLGSLRTIRLKGQIVRSESVAMGSYPPGFAVHFTDLDRETRRYINQFLKTNS